MITLLQDGEWIPKEGIAIKSTNDYSTHYIFFDNCHQQTLDGSIADAIAIAEKLRNFSSKPWINDSCPHIKTTSSLDHYFCKCKMHLCFECYNWHKALDCSETNPGPDRIEYKVGNERGSKTASIIEGLEKQIKQRDTQLAQLREELRRKKEHESHQNNTISQLRKRQAELQVEVGQWIKDYQSLREQFETVKKQYIPFPQVVNSVGEKSKEIDELKRKLDDSQATNITLRNRINSIKYVLEDI